MFMAEKSLTADKIQIDLGKGEQFSDWYRDINPRCMVPALKLPNGLVICEVTPIWTYLEALQPEPPLLGTTAEEKAVIAMWERRMDLDGYIPAAEALRNAASAFAGHAVAGPHDYDQIPELAARGRARVQNFYADLNARLAESAYVAGAAFSAADITAIVTVQFAVNAVEIAVPDRLTALLRWHETISARPSIFA